MDEADLRKELIVGLNIAFSAVKVFMGVTGVVRNIGICALKQGISNIKILQNVFNTLQGSKNDASEGKDEVFDYSKALKCLQDDLCRQELLEHFLENWKSFKMEVSKTFHKISTEVLTKVMKIAEKIVGAICRTVPWC